MPAAGDGVTLAADRAFSAPGRDPMVRDFRLPVRDGAVAQAGTVTGPVIETGRNGLLLPALANAHDHGRFFYPLSFGVPDQPLEMWLAGLALQPNFDQHLTALAYLSRLARRGVASTMHMHRARPESVLLEEAAQVCSAAEVVAVRLAFAVPLQDRNHVAYSCGGAQPIPAGPPWRPLHVPTAGALLDVADAIAAEHDSALVEVQYGPLGPQWVTETLLAGVAERSAANRRRVHMHMLESRRQREWADAAYPDGLVEHLDRLGLLSPRLSVAHGVWLRPDEIALLAERGVTVVVNSSSNLRLRSGIAPFAAFLDAGVRCAMGMDGGTLDDDDDAFRELRLLSMLHAGTGLTPKVGAEQVFRTAISGASTVHRGSDAWGLAPGATADVVVLDADELGRDVLMGHHDELGLLLGRATSEHVRHVWIGGRHIVSDGGVTSLDEGEVLQEPRDRAAHIVPHPGSGQLLSMEKSLQLHYRNGQHTR